MDQDDGELVELYRQGRTDALEELVRRHRNVLYGFILRMTEHSGDADEVFQETWIRVMRHVGNYRNVSFRAWLLRICHNLLIDRARARKPKASLDEPVGDGEQTLGDLLPGSGHDAARQVEDRDLGTRIRAAVDALPAEQRAVFLMRTQADVPFKEIARIQKVPINTALARMHYAVQRLRGVLEADYVALGRVS
jgi:RNA polymerase sigma-70 factor (ECF subfamily)